MAERIIVTIEDGIVLGVYADHGETIEVIVVDIDEHNIMDERLHIHGEVSIPMSLLPQEIAAEIAEMES